MKKFLAILLSLAIVFAFASCGSDSDTSNDTIAKVTAKNGANLTIDVMTMGQAPSGDSGSAPEMPSGDQGGSGDGQTPPDMPSGDANSSGSSSDSQTPPEKPSGSDDQNSNGQSSDGQTPPEMPSGDQGGNGGMQGGGQQPSQSKSITITDTSILYKLDNDKETAATLDDISVGSYLKITYDDDGETMTKIIIGDEDDFADEMNSGNNAPDGSAPSGEAPDGNGAGGNGGAGGSSSSSVVYGGATEITSSATESDKTYSTETEDESALLVSTSDEVTIENATVTKSGDSDGGDNCNFYGQNAALLVKDGTTATITGSTITSDANGANGVFSYGGNGGQNGADGDGTTVIISDSTITTTGDGSGGIMTTGGGITKASNLTVTTSGQSSAAIRTDRGGGTVTVDGGTYTTNGLGSPAIYSTADITVSDADLVSNLSEGVCIEGLNSVDLENCNMTVNNTKTNGNATFYDSIMIYQSMSGDASSGTSTFTMNGGTLTSKNGHVFHVTNTNAEITLSDVTINNEDDDNILLSVCDDGWSGGSNVATVDATKQALEGAILVGDNSTLTLNLSDSSTFSGYINGEIKNVSGDTVSSDVGTVNVILDSSSTWTLTGDSYVTSFSGDASNIISNGYTLYVNGEALTGTN